jgi:putative endonuclease
MDKECFFYMVKCKDDSIYSGIAFDVQERQKKHNNGTGARYTAVHRPVVLILWERYDSLSAAMKREAQVKRFPKDKKIQLAYRFYDMDVKVQQYFDNQPSPMREICLKLRQLILQIFPDTGETFKAGCPAYAEGKFYIRAAKNQVNLGFSITGMTKKQIERFPGNGKITRTLQFKTPADINEKKIVKLLKMTADSSNDN